MLQYYFELALHSLRRNVVLTALMIGAVGVGIGASMTALTALRSMSADPIPDKSSRLFTPQLDAWGPQSTRPNQGASGDRLPVGLTYRDAQALMQAHPAPRQAAMYSIGMDVRPAQGRPFQASGRATSADFFPMFEVPFASGAPWGQKEDDGRESVVVLGAKLAARAFPQGNAVGRTLNLGGRDYRVLGVLKPWAPLPRFYDPTYGAYSEGEDFLIPYSTAIARQITASGYENCRDVPTGGWEAHLNSSCVWILFWAELPTAGQVRNFRAWLLNYAAEQRQLGRFHWPPRVDLHDVVDWLVYNQVVPGAVRAISLVADSFLVVCLLNAVGVMLARFASRGKEFGLRRALGASRRNVFLQCITESAAIGVLGGMLGLALTAIGLMGLRALLGVTDPTSAVHRLVSLDSGMVVITLAVAVAATVCAALYPILRASRVQPAWQLKVQ
ncbi:MAG TPA: ABC transporter permease [Steroidobacteraceae bacterium]|nr:ABC transporter permease [Steroidobacteraceae bacterium]